MLTRRLCWILLTAVVVQGYPGYPPEWVPPHAHKFTVEYKDEVKLVRNVEKNVTYCLYEADPLPDDCKTFKPVKIPLGKAFVEPTPVIPLFEYIGERESIGSVFYEEYITSTCVKQMINNKLILSAGTKNNNGTETFCVDTTSFHNRSITAAFVTNDTKPDHCGDSMVLPKNTILYSDAAEDEMDKSTTTIILAQAEWIYYVATFYNKEHLAVKFLDNLYGKWDCIMASIAECNRGFLAIDGTPKVAFMPYYNNSDDEWSRPNNESYYAQMIKYAYAEMVMCDGGTSAMNTSELVKCINDADVCIFQTDYNTIDVVHKLQGLNCIKNNSYYDVYGNLNSWFEDTSTSADDLLCEFVCAIYKQYVIDVGRGVVYNPRWLRNSSQIKSKANITSSELPCPSPEYTHAAPITPFDCAGCDSNLPLFDALFAFFVQLSALALCCAVVMSLRKIRMSNHQKRQPY